MKGRRLAAAGLVLVAVAGAMAGSAQAAPPLSRAEETPTATPIKHFVYLMQENHSFDNYFGTYPGADGIPAGTCMPRDLTDPATGCVEPYEIGEKGVEDLGHSQKIFQRQLRQGNNDGFIDAFRQEGSDTVQAMGYYDADALPYYWNVADEYVLFDRFFTSAGAGSVANHMFWVTGQAGGDKDTIPDEGFGDFPTIFDRLHEKGVDWKFYVQNYDPGINFRTYKTVGDGTKGSQVVWVPPLDFPRFLDTPELFERIVPLEQYYEDLSAGTLPAVSYVVPSGASEHPPGSIAAGQHFVRSLINALARSTAWSSSAFLWTYDDWGGWYDHVVPPQVDQFGYGYRAPALLVGPFAKRGHVDHTQLDFTSGLKFIEENWGVAPMAERDAAANNFLSAFDFAQPTRPPVFTAADRAPPIRYEGKRHIIYVAYGSAVAVPSLVIAYALLSSTRRRVGRLRSREAT